MIEKMKKVHIVSTVARKEDMLKNIRDLGILHLAEKKNANPQAIEKFNHLSKNASILREYQGASNQLPELDDDDFQILDEAVTKAVEQKKYTLQQRDMAFMAAEKLRPWGDFRPKTVAEIRKAGIDLHFYQMGKKEIRQLSENPDAHFIRLSPVNKMETVAVIGELDDSISANEFEIPDRGLSQIEEKIAGYEALVQDCDAILKTASRQMASYDAQILKSKNEMEYSQASAATGNDSGLIWLCGYIPADDEEKFKLAANENGWAYALEDAAEDDEKVPTKVKYNKVTALMKPVFDILGTVPGYREYDISFWFLCFFTLFVAMIIGDAGYGLIFLLLGVFLHVKQKKVSNIVLLIYVLAAATIAWGAVTGTWFGLEGAMQVPLLKALVIPAFANYPAYFEGVTTVIQQNNIMTFCFIIGTVQLSLACIMSIRKKLGQKDFSWIADVGWLISINALYYVVLFLVIAVETNLGLVALIILFGFALCVLFGGMTPGSTFKNGIKRGLADTFTIFLNTISAFGNIMSYIRLFAVGMASLAIAQSFNNMASGFEGVLVIAGVLIMIIGHTLNIVMGFLSVVVHGVRLNLLEFSGQLGMEWTGITYEPFKKIEK